MTVRQVAGSGICGVFTGVAADTKPTTGEGFGAGATFLETDTGKMFTNDGSSWIVQGSAGTLLDEVSYALKGSLPTPAFLLGNDSSIVTGLTATESVERMVGGDHICLVVTNLVGTGTVTFTGDKISESTGLVTTAQTEAITVDANGSYLTDAHWLRITDITVADITSLTMEIRSLDFQDLNDKNFKVTGYHCEVTPTNSGTVNFRLEIMKAQADGSKKMTIVEMEDINVKGVTAWIVDNFHATETSVRGDRGYSTATATPWVAGEPFHVSASDFDTEFSSDENIIEGASKEEGVIVKITWLQCDFMSLTIFITEQ